MKPKTSVYAIIALEAQASGGYSRQQNFTLQERRNPWIINKHQLIDRRFPQIPSDYCFPPNKRQVVSGAAQLTCAKLESH